MRPWTGVVNARRTSGHDVSRNKFGKVFEPQAGCLGFAVTGLPRLNYLVRLAETCGHDADWIFNRDMINRAVEHRHKEPYGGFLLGAAILEPSRSAGRQIGARRVSNEQIPVFAIGDLEGILLKVFPSPLARQKITTPCVMPASRKGIANHAAELASHQDAEFVAHEFRGWGLGGNQLRVGFLQLLRFQATCLVRLAQFNYFFDAA